MLPYIYQHPCMLRLINVDQHQVCLSLPSKDIVSDGRRCDNGELNEEVQLLTLPSQVTQWSQQHLVELLNTAAQQTCNPG